MQRHLLTTVLLILALLCYTLGATAHGTLLLVLGGVAELLFWIRLAGGRRKQRRP